MKFSFKKLFKFLLVILFIWAIYVLFFRKIVEGATTPPPKPTTPPPKPPTPPPKPTTPPPPPTLPQPLGSGGKYTKAQCSALSIDKGECQASITKNYGCYVSFNQNNQKACFGGI